MFELWERSANSWNINSDGEYAGPSLVRLVSRHRTPWRALAALDNQTRRHRHYVIINANGDEVTRLALMDMVANAGFYAIGFK